MSLCDRSAVELRSLIASKEISPVELLVSCLERIDAVNPTVNAIVALDREAAVGAAEAAEKAVLNGSDIGPLHGLPIGIKDLNDTKGLRTTYGAVEFSDHVPLEDEPMVADIRRAGGIILGKTNTPEFGSGANTLNDVYGFTGNAFDPELSAAGSSGGSAVALACSMVPLASGSDLGGSLRVPASFNGVVGFRSTPGLVGDTKKSFPWWPLSVEGPMGRSVADAALLLSAQVGERPGDALSWPGARPDFTALPLVDLSHLKVAFSQDLGFAPIDQAVRDLFDTRVRAFSGLFAESGYEAPPLEDIDRIFQVLRAVGYLAKNHDRLQATPGVVGPNVTANTKLGLKYSALDVALALKDQAANFRRFQDFMGNYDILITPAISTQPYPKGKLYPDIVEGKEMETYISWVAISYGVSLLGNPAVILPCGRDEKGLPFGIQLIGRYGRDHELLATAAALEGALAKIDDCMRPLPDLRNLGAMKS